MENNELLKEIEALKAERDALATKVYEQHGFIESVMANIGAGATLDEVSDMLCDWWDSYKLPHACLLDVQAEAGRKGYIACLNFTCHTPDNWISLADKYAETVRRGGAE